MNKDLDLTSAYAHAFFLLCQNKKVNWKNYLETNLGFITLLTADNNHFWNWFQELSFMQAKKESKIIFQDKVEVYWLNLINILIEDYNLSLFLSILQLLEGLFYQKLGIKMINLYSVIPLHPDQLSVIKTKLEKKLKSVVKLIVKLDKSLIGGIRVEVDDQIFDNSLQRKLTDLKQTTI